MPCFKPLQARRLDDGTITFNAMYGQGDSLELPCGQCTGCRMSRSKMWAVRCMHEASLHEHNSFITLTYNEQYLPKDGSLNYRHFQNFMKRLRKRFNSVTIRFYMCGEYGENFSRPHYHALLFGLEFPDKTLWKTTSANAHIYRSKILEELWTFGYSSIGTVTLQSAGYVARYVMKKINGNQADEHYTRINPTTGEVIKITPEFNRMSRKPGIASTWFEKFYKDVYPHDSVILEGGKKMRPPKFYDKKYDSLFPEQMEAIKQERILRALKLAAENTPERLGVKEEVLESKLSKLKREL